MHGGAASAPLRFIPGTIYLSEPAHNRPGRGGDYNGQDRRSRNYIMTNQDRIKARIARDKARKAEKRKPLVERYGTFENVATMQNLLRSLQRRRKNTEWKGSVQSFVAHAPVKLKRMHDDLLKGEINVNQTIKHLVIRERGKVRECRAIMIDSRVIQGLICDSCITPLMERRLIYDNPASTKGKGVSHARGRIDRHLQKLVREHGKDFYILNYDLKKFFDSIRHDRCKEEMEKLGADDRLVDIAMYFVKMYQMQDLALIADPAERERKRRQLEANEGVGATLGSQISQALALLIPNGTDHAVKDRGRVKAYIRYMDDGFAGHGSKERLRELMKTLTQAFADVGHTVNVKKTHIVKASKGFQFLKVTYTVTETGKIVKKIARSSIIRMRRKLNKFKRLVKAGKMRLDDVFCSFMSWWGTAKNIARTYRQRKRMLALYNKNFHRYKTGGIKA